PAGHAAADHDVVVDRLERHVGSDRGRRVPRALPGLVDGDQQPRAPAVRGDDDPVEQKRWQLLAELRGQRRPAVDAEAADAAIDDRGTGEALAADRRADAVGTDQDVTL